MALVELARYFNSFEAGLARARLDAEDISSFVFDTNMNWEGMGGVIQIRLMVDEEDLEAARRVLADEAPSRSS
jgi:Putative prokaryotic signal transducing protein